MLAITSLLGAPYAARINQIIKSLETEFGLDDVQATPDPHLTYQLAGVSKRAAAGGSAEKSGPLHPARSMLTPPVWAFSRASTR